MRVVLALAFVVFVQADICSVANLVIRCDMRCDGTNITDLKSTGNSNPPPGTLLPPSEAAVMLAQVEGGSFPSSHQKERALAGAVAPSDGPLGIPLAFIETARLQDGVDEAIEFQATPGSPSSKSSPNDSDFDNSTAYAPVHSALSSEELTAHIGDVSRLEWVKIKSASFGCKDGRYTNGGLYTDGGDFGEMLLAMNVYEQIVSKRLTQGDVTDIFVSFLRKTSKKNFAMCTDASAVKQLATAVGVAELEMDMPPEEIRESLLLRVTSPEFIGCQHLRDMMKNPEMYAVRKGLVESFIRSFYHILWNQYHPMQDKLSLKVLTGTRTERAVVKVKTSEWCLTQQGLAPLIPSKTKTTSAIFTNPDAVAKFRADLASFFSNHVSPAVNADEMRARLRTLGDGQAHLTSKAVAGMLRSYTVTLK